LSSIQVDQIALDAVEIALELSRRRDSSLKRSSPLPYAVHNEGSSGYYGWLRHDILKYVPRDAMRVLSVGCGGGITEAELVARGSSVVGIERNAAAAAAARERRLAVFGGDVSDVDLVIRNSTAAFTATYWSVP
jgi:SAM-dependent methyltransferase